jgi:toxin ParE1/3/4
MAAHRWHVHLSEAADQDFVGLLSWTRRTFGVRQAETYRDTIIAALTALADGPENAGGNTRDEISPGLYSLHVARRGRHGRHLVLYRVAK